MPAWMDKCVESVLSAWEADPKKRPKPREKGQSKESQAWAICTAQYKKKFGHAPEREAFIRPQLLYLQEKYGGEEVKLTFSDDEKRELLQRAVHDLYGEPEGYGLSPWSTWYVVTVYDDHAVVRHGDRLYAIPYAIIDHHTAELGEPEEVVAAFVTAEAETHDILLYEGWLPKGMTQTDLDDGDFAWLSFEYQKASADERDKMNKRMHRKLPFKIHGKVSVEGWLAAWTAARWTTYLRPSLRGGIARDEVMSKLKEAKPAKIGLDEEGRASVKEGMDEESAGRILYEGELRDYVVEDATQAERDKFSLVFSGTVIPKPNTEHGVWSLNKRLYPPQSVDETYDRSTQFIDEGGVATVFTSHAAASDHTGRLPIGKVLSYSRDDGAVRFRGGIVDTAEGADAIKLLEAGVLGTVSLRSYDWESHKEEVKELGPCEVVDWCVICGIDFATAPGLPGTKVKKEEVEMDLNKLTLEELREQRPDLIAELVAEAPATEEETNEQEPNEEAKLRLAVLEASCTGISSVVARMLSEKVKSVDDIEGVLEEVRRAAIQEVYGTVRKTDATNLRGKSGDDETKKEPVTEDVELSDMQKQVVEAAGGTV